MGAVDEVEVTDEFVSWSLVEAIWVRRDARSLRRSVVGYVWISTDEEGEDEDEDEEVGCARR